MTKTKSTYMFYGVPWYVFAIFALLVLYASFQEILPLGMIGAFPVMIVLGAILSEFGDKTPIINSYFGGGPIIIIFGSAALVFFKILPQSQIEIISNFMKGEGFLDFYIAALITGSILGMSRELLIKASIRYLPCIIGGVTVAIALTGLVGMITGYGAQKAIFFITIPIMGGGMGAGAVPLSKIFGAALNQTPESLISIMIPAVALGNAIAIILGGLLNRLGKVKPSLTGNGRLLVASDNESAQVNADANYTKEMNTLKLKNFGVGLFVSTSFFMVGIIINKIFPSIHSYAWMILAVAFVKILNLLPQQIEISCAQWFQFIMSNLTIVLLVGIGVAFTDLGQVVAAFQPIYLILVFTTVFGAVIGSAFIGNLVGFYMIEASITAGLCMANMGGTGDVAVLSASNRMELMPFAQISSRLGGAFMLILSSILLKLFM